MAISSSGAGGSGDSAAGRRLTEERTRLGGDATARGSEGRPCHNDPQRESGSSLPDDESRTESSVQERIVVDAEELQAPHRLTSRDLVHLDEDTAGVSSRPAIGLRTAGAFKYQFWYGAQRVHRQFRATQPFPRKRIPTTHEYRPRGTMATTDSTTWAPMFRRAWPG
ncbi:hypothetical protein B0H19DRAFT_1084307 [Mycena capillaripes]|nr:hypothetical protein B0H19DRAFT_1084307 [Mycena capillaripes]